MGRVDGDGDAGGKTPEESRVGRGFWPTLAVAGAAAGACVAILARIAKRDDSASVWAIMLCLGCMLFAPAIALLLVNAPKMLRDWRASRAEAIDGVGFDGMPVQVERFDGALWADAGQAAKALGEDPASWPLKFAQAGPGALRREGGRMWVRRDAWSWRCSREGDLGLRRMRSRLEADGFGAYDRREESDRRARAGAFEEPRPETSTGAGGAQRSAGTGAAGGGEGSSDGSAAG